MKKTLGNYMENGTYVFPLGTNQLPADLVEALGLTGLKVQLKFVIEPEDEFVIDDDQTEEGKDQDRKLLVSSMLVSIYIDKDAL